MRPPLPKENGEWRELAVHCILGMEKCPKHAQKKRKYSSEGCEPTQRNAPLPGFSSASEGCYRGSLNGNRPPSQSVHLGNQSYDLCPTRATQALLESGDQETVMSHDALNSLSPVRLMSRKTRSASWPHSPRLSTSRKMCSCISN